jgi:class 3 adenylate cyclase
VLLVALLCVAFVDSPALSVGPVESQYTSRTASPQASQWSTAPRALGLTEDRLWLRFSVDNADAKDQVAHFRLQGPLVEEVVARSGDVEVRAGERVPRALWPVRGRHAELPLLFPAQSRTEVVVWVEGTRGLSTEFELRTPHTAAGVEAERFGVLGIALGIMLGLVLQGFAAAAIARRGLHALQALSSTFIALWLAGSAGVLQLWWGAVPEWLLAGLHVCALLAALALSRVLFGLPVRAPAWDRAARVASVGLLLTFASWAVLPPPTYHQVFGLVFFVVQGGLVALGVLRLRAGDRTGRVYLTTWALSLAIAVPGWLASIGALPVAVLDVVPMAAGLVWVIGLSLTTADHYRAERERADLLRTAGERFVPREFLQMLGRSELHEVRAGDHEQRTLTVFFSDLRSFSRIVEAQTPDENIAFINDYLTAMEQPIREHQGFVEGYVGDAIMALFVDADAGVRAAIANLRALAPINARRAAEGREPLRIGIGLSTGELMLGTIGSATRLKCGVIGDAVNTAARTESMTKHYGASLLITGDTQRALAGRYEMRHIDDVVPAGKTTPVEIWEVLDGLSDDERHLRFAHNEAFAQARACWRAGQLDPCLAALALCSAADPVVVLLRDRCEQLRARGLPADWRGVTQLEKK